MGERAYSDGADGDHIVHLHQVSWADYERILRIRGEKSVPRINYLEGELEIMSPGQDHESIKTFIGHLVEVYCLDRDIEIFPAGSWTIKKRLQERGAEADECYIFGRRGPKKPDLAIEVIWTSGGLDKLEIYRKLGVREVWIWEKRRIQVWRLRGQAYRMIERSLFLPDLDLGLLERYVHADSLNQAVRRFRAAVRRREDKEGA